MCVISRSFYGVRTAIYSDQIAVAQSGNSFWQNDEARHTQLNDLRKFNNHQLLLISTSRILYIFP